MTAPAPSVVYVVPDKMGGMMNIIAALLEHRRPDGFATHAVLTHNRFSLDTRYGRRLSCDSQTTVEYSLPLENLHPVMRRLARAIPRGPGVLVTNDMLELATLSVHDLGRAVISILHGDYDYYYDLAVKHEAVIHAFVAYSRRVYERLVERLPQRASTIFHLPYGIPMAARVRQPIVGPLRLIYTGRLDREKGVLDLPSIDRRLRDRGAAVRWTIVGGGPDEGPLLEEWSGAPDVRFTGTVSAPEVLEMLADQDVFVLPTRGEGFPVSLLEAMGAGVVPVVSDIPSGVPEVVEPGITGFRPAVGAIEAFAEAIAGLAQDRARLERMSAACRALVEERYDIRDRVTGYEALYSRYAELYRPLRRDARLQYGSRLDQPWIPNSLVRAVRSLTRGRSATNLRPIARRAR